MIPPAFTYVRASSVDEALELAAEHGEDAKYLAGGHSLLPLMKLRMAAPAVLIDLGRITELSYIRDEGTYVAIGALTRHHDVATSAVLAADIPLLAHTAGEVGDPQIRHRGTIGGSAAHGDSASDLPATLLALDATFVIRGEPGTRSVPAAEFFKSIFETAIEPGELLTEIQVPKPASPAAWSFQKFTKRAIDWAIVGVAVQGTSVALISMGMTPLRATAVESALASGASITDAAALAAEGTSAGSDIHGSKAYREHLARVLVRRGLEEAASRAASVALPGRRGDGCGPRRATPTPSTSKPAPPAAPRRTSCHTSAVKASVPPSRSVVSRTMITPLPLSLTTPRSGPRGAGSPAPAESCLYLLREKLRTAGRPSPDYHPLRVARPDHR